MLSDFWNNFFYEPIYNLLIFLISVVPFGDLGIAVILLTVLIKTVLIPFTNQVLKDQQSLQKLAPKIEEIKKLANKDKEKEARQMLALYRENKINPFRSIGLVIVQIVILISLYVVFIRGLEHRDILYSFVQYPEQIKTAFLGLLPLNDKSFLIGLITGLTQFAYTMVSMPKQKKSEGKEIKKISDKPSFQAEFKKSFEFQARYVFPILTGIITWTLPAMIGLYWTTANLFSTAQGLLLARARPAEAGSKAKE